MRKYERLILALTIGATFCLGWFFCYVLLPSPLDATAMNYSNVVEGFGMRNHRQETQFIQGYVAGSTLVHLDNLTKAGNGDYLHPGWDSCSPMFFETASNTWAIDGVCTWVDGDGDGKLDTYDNAAASIDTAGGKFYIWFYDTSGI